MNTTMNSRRPFLAFLAACCLAFLCSLARPAGAAPPDPDPGAAAGLCKQLVPLGTGDDTAARNALEALRRHVTRPGADAERRQFASALADALADARGDAAGGARGSMEGAEVRAFLLNELKWCAGEECVARVAPWLNDPTLGDPAAMVLLEVRAPAAAKALADALPAARGPGRVTIIKALGVLRASSAGDEILKSAASDDATLRLAALGALADLGDPRAGELLAKAANAAGPFERAKGAAMELLYARRRAERGDKDSAARSCRDLLRSRAATGPSTAGPSTSGESATGPSPSGESGVRAAALATLVDVAGEAAMADVLDAAASPDAAYRNAALNLAQTLPGPAATARWVEALGKLGPAARADVLAMLGRRGDRSAEAAVRAALRDPDAAVRAEAIPALARLCGGDSAEALLAVVRSGGSADATPGARADAKAAAEALARLPGDRPLTLAAGALAGAPPPAAAALLDLLGARAAESQADAIFARARDPEPAVRQAALRAMEKAARAEDQGRLIELAMAAPDAGDEALALKAVVAAAQKEADPEQRPRRLLAAMASAAGPKRLALARALPRVGGQAALDALADDARAGAPGADPSAGEIALRALAEWPDASAAGPLLALAAAAPRDEAGLKRNVLAVRGAVQLARAAPVSPAERAALCAAALRAARRPEEKRQALAALAADRGLESLKVAEAAVSDPEVRADAAALIARLVLPSRDGDPGLRGPAAAAALRQAIPLLGDAALRARAEKFLATPRAGGQ